MSTAATNSVNPSGYHSYGLLWYLADLVVVNSVREAQVVKVEHILHPVPATVTTRKQAVSGSSTDVSKQIKK